MTRGVRARVLAGLLILLVIGAGAVALIAGNPPKAVKKPPVAARPKLALLTSLPLLFGERFALEAPRSPALARIEEQFEVVPISLADAASLGGFAQLLMAHPRAQPAGALVDLDAWVRAGGRVVLLADPRLEWESSLPLGDPLRPPPAFADTGLLAHWGLRLEIDDAGEGRLRATASECRLTREGLSAQCRIGRGTARIIADADFMMGEGPGAEARLALLLAQLTGRDSR